MENLEVFNSAHSWKPFEFLGLTSSFFTIDLATLYNTWVVLLVLLLVGIAYRFFLHKNKIASYMVLGFVRSFMDLMIQSVGAFYYNHFAFVTSIFIFILTCNWIALLPFVEEPTKYLNTTLALGLISFFYKEFYAIKIHGFGAYIKEFFYPFFVMFPLNVISHFSKIISISFRLFGNIFGGSIITHIYLSALSTSFIAELIGLFSGINFLVISFFIIFEGLIQAFVFTMLTLTYLAIAIASTDQGALE